MEKRPALERKFKERLDSLDEIELPDSLEWMDEHLPEARKYIEDTHSAIRKAMFYGDETEFNINLERYIKAWLRVWQLMAKHHVESRDFSDVDMRYYRHMPDGCSFVMDSEKLGCSIQVFPRKPQNPPKDAKWMTAGELIKVNEAPIIMAIMERFGAWFDRSEKNIDADFMKEAIEASKKLARKKIEDGTGLKFKRTHRGWDIYE